MPYPNEHAARIVEPSKFESDSFRRKNISDGIDAIMGRLKGETSMTIQAYRFDKTKFSSEQAKSWLKEHDIKYISFEAASDKALQAKSTFGAFEVKAYSQDDPLSIKIMDATNPERVIRFKASDETIDRSGEVIMVGGWDLSDFIKNPVVMQFHDYNQWPIGRAISAGIMSDGLYIDAEFDPPEVDEAADLVFRKIKHGTIKSGSVGFVPQDYVTRGTERSRLPEFKQLFDKFATATRIFLKQSLLEWTICPVPCNPNALTASLQKSLNDRFSILDSDSIQAASSESESMDYEAMIKKVEEFNKKLEKKG